MNHPFFSPQALALLLDPGAWRLVATALPAEAREPVTPAHQRWRLRNTHAHAHRELLIALEGDQPYGHASGVVRCRPGTILFFDRLEAHDDRYPPGSAGFCHLWCSITASGLLVREWRAQANGATSSRPLALAGLDDLPSVPLSAILDRQRSLLANQTGVARLDLMVVAATIAARLVEAGRHGTEADDSRATRAVAIARAHITETYGVGVSLDSLAQMTCYSRFHFLRLFRTHTGCSLRMFTDRVRRAEVLRARDQGGGARLAAERIGFASASAFSRWCQRNDISWRRGRSRSSQPPEAQ